MSSPKLGWQAAQHTVVSLSDGVSNEQYETHLLSYYHVACWNGRDIYLQETIREVEEYEEDAAASRDIARSSQRCRADHIAVDKPV